MDTLDEPAMPDGMDAAIDDAMQDLGIGNARLGSPHPGALDPAPPAPSLVGTIESLDDSASLIMDLLTEAGNTNYRLFAEPTQSLGPPTEQPDGMVNILHWQADRIQQSLLLLSDELMRMRRL